MLFLVHSYHDVQHANFQLKSYFTIEHRENYLKILCYILITLYQCTSFISGLWCLFWWNVCWCNIGVGTDVSRNARNGQVKLYNWIMLQLSGYLVLPHLVQILITFETNEKWPGKTMTACFFKICLSGLSVPVCNVFHVTVIGS